MARIARIHSQIRANRLMLANRLRVPELITPFARIALRGAKNCESQFCGDSRESLARYENRGFSVNRFARIAPIRVANRRAINWYLTMGR